MLERMKKSLATVWPLYVLDLKVRNRRHWLSLAWVLAPLFMALLLALLIESLRYVKHVGVTEIGYPVFVLTGLIMWQIFADAVLMPLRQMQTYQLELRSAKMTPQLAVQIGFFDLLIGIALRFVFLAVTLPMLSVEYSVGLVIWPVLALIGAVLGAAIGMIVSLLSLLIDDVTQAVGLFLTVGLLLSPVFYQARGIEWLQYNPLGSWVDAGRDVAIGNTIDWAIIGSFAVAAAIMLIVAVAWIRAGRRHYIGPLA